ncbi:MAG: hypothetical protein WC809_19485 [Sinimarinibacterium sp.]|jgi:hypothetical protein
MRQRLQAACILLLSTLLAACAATPYQPLAKGYGYSEQKLESDRYRVAFAGNGQTSQDAVQNYLMYRAAELTLQNGRDYFVLVGTSTQGEQGRSPDVGVGIGGFRFGGRGGLGIGIGTSTGGDKTAYRAQAEILLRSGTKPADDPQAFDARDIKSNLEAQISRPPSS